MITSAPYNSITALDIIAMNIVPCFWRKKHGFPPKTRWTDLAAVLYCSCYLLPMSILIILSYCSPRSRNFSRFSLTFTIYRVFDSLSLLGRDFLKNNITHQTKILKTVSPMTPPNAATYSTSEVTMLFNYTFPKINRLNADLYTILTHTIYI